MSDRWFASAGASAPVDPTVLPSVENLPLGLDIGCKNKKNTNGTREASKSRKSIGIQK